MSKCIYLFKTSISTYFSSTTGGGGGEGGGVGCFTGSSTGFSISSFFLCLLNGFLSNVFLVMHGFVLGDGGFSGSLGVRTSGVGGGCVGVLTSTSSMSSPLLASTSSGTYNWLLS